MFSYNSFKSGNNNFEEENMHLAPEADGLLPLIADDIIHFEQQCCQYNEGAHAVFDDYETIFNPTFSSGQDDYMANQQEQRSLQGPQQAKPYLSNNPIERKIVLFKELTAYPNYGNPSGNVDILYTGNQGQWRMDLPAQATISNTMSSNLTLQLRIILDDHLEVPEKYYSTSISFNKNILFDGVLRASHGTPRGGRFTNWRLLKLNIDNLRKNNIIEIRNTSRTGPMDWIAIDWMQITN